MYWNFMHLEGNAKLTREDLEKIISASNDLAEPYKFSLIDKNIEGIDLQNIDLSIFNLENDNISLAECILNRDLIEKLVHLGRKNFRQVVIKNEDFSLKYTHNENIGLAFNQGFYIENVDFSSSHFENCNFAQATFVECNLLGVSFTACQNLDLAIAVNCKQDPETPISTNLPEGSTKNSYIIELLKKIIYLKFLKNMLGDYD